MTPEEQARQEIDRQLEQCGWIVQDRKDLNTYAGSGVAIRKFSLLPGHGEADYLLYVNGQAIGVIESSPQELPTWGITLV